MHFFSRKKALLTASLAALSGLAACGDDVTVPVRVDPVVIIITPSNAAMNIGESLNFAVQVTGGPSTNAPSLNLCTTSNAAVATATKDGSSCKVTAVAAGNATVTATATTGQVASSAVSVSAQAPGITNFTVSPNVASLAPAGTITIVPNVTKPNAAGTVTYSYISSSTALATVGTVAANGSVVVTAVAPGVVTITATASIPAGNGFSAATQTATSTITIGAFPSGITSLSVQPAGPLNLPVGRTAGLTASVVQPAGAPQFTLTYTSSSPAVATVSATGLITAITTGTANITVTATSASNATFAAGNLSQVIAVTVSPLANVSIQQINQGPYVTTGLDSVYNESAQGQFPSGSIGNPPLGPIMGTIAGIRRSANAQVNQPIDVTNTKDQIQVILNLQANGQRVDSVVVYIDPASTAARRAAARQIFTNGDAGNQQTVSITAFILTEDFTTNETTGVGEVHYVNGLKAISASVWTTLSTGQSCPVAITAGNTCELQNAANIRQNVNFNNIDGFALKMTRPLNSAVDLANRTWWGGPTVADPTVPSTRDGWGSFQTYPVIFTPGREIKQISATFGRCLGFQASGIPNFVTDSAGPYIFTFGATAPAAPPASSNFINCNTVVGAYDQADQYRFEDYPMVAASLDNSNNPGPRVLYAYNPTTAADAYAGPRFGILGLWRTSPQLISPDPIRIDYQSPVLTLAVTQANGERWVNDAYLFNSGYTATDFIAAVTPVTGVGVGLFLSANRNTQFLVASANPNCGIQTFQPVGGTRTTASVGQIPQLFTPPVANRESPCDFTPNAFVAQATETDRLGNRGRIGNLFIPAVTAPPSAVAPAVPATPLFGIDNTAPEIQLAWDGPGGLPDMPNIYRATGDSIFQPVNGAVAATPVATTGNGTDFWFGTRYTDTRSGFNITNHGTRTVKRFRPDATPLLSNRAVVSTVATRTMNFVGGQGNPVENEDFIYRRDSVLIYGAGSIAATTGAGTVPVSANPAVGYYQYDLSLTDRAGNTSRITERAVIDQTSPLVTGVRIPAVLGASGATGAGTAIAQPFIPTGVDDVEAVDADLFLRYQAMGMVGDSSAGSTVINNGARMRFRRDRFANFHNAWAVFGDTLLATPFGPDAVLSSNGLMMPIPTIRGIEPVDTSDAPIFYGGGATNPFVGFKPNFLGIYAFDVRATHINLGAPNGWPVPYAASFPFKDLGMTNFNLFGSAGNFGEAAYVENIFPGIVSNGVRWDTKDLNTATAGIDRLVAWHGQGASGGTLEFRAITSTVVTQPPFPMVHLFKWEADAQHTGTGLGAFTTGLNDSTAGQWVFIGTVTAAAPQNPAINDQGATRFWRYQFTAAAFPTVTNGMIVQPGVTVGCYRAVGVDAIGDGITTRSFGSGCPVPGVNQGQTATVASAVNQTLTFRAYGNGTGTISTGVAPTMTLTKTSTNGVERVSQNRPNIGVTVTITPTNSSTVDRAPSGCIVNGAVTFPTASLFTCTYGEFAPNTITVIFELPFAGGP